MFSTVMGIIIVIFGPKAFKYYICDCFNWCRNIQLVTARCRNSSQGVRNIMRIDDIFRQVLRTWNPLDSPEELEST